MSQTLTLRYIILSHCPDQGESVCVVLCKCIKHRWIFSQMFFSVQIFRCSSVYRSSFCSNQLHRSLPALIQLCLFNSDGRYLTCGLFYWRGQALKKKKNLYHIAVCFVWFCFLHAYMWLPVSSPTRTYMYRCLCHSGMLMNRMRITSH